MFSIRDFEDILLTSTSNLALEQVASVAVASTSNFPALAADETDPSQSEFLDALANLPIQGDDELLQPNEQEEMQE
jgi:hypothetical protein